MSETENGFDPTKPTWTRDGREVFLELERSIILGSMKCDDDVVLYHWNRADGKHFYGKSNLDLVNVAPPVTDAAEPDSTANLEFMACSLYDFVRELGVHGSNAKLWGNQSQEHREWWRDAIRYLRKLRFDTLDAALRASAPEPADASGMTLIDNGWQPIATAPKDGTHIWLYRPDCPEDDRQAVGWWHEDILAGTEWWMDPADREQSEPTYWRPLPAAPTPTPLEGTREGEDVVAILRNLCSYAMVSGYVKNVEYGGASHKDWDRRAEAYIDGYARKATPAPGAKS